MCHAISSVGPMSAYRVRSDVHSSILSSCLWVKVYFKRVNSAIHGDSEAPLQFGSFWSYSHPFLLRIPGVVGTSKCRSLRADNAAHSQTRDGNGRIWMEQDDFECDCMFNNHRISRNFRDFFLPHNNHPTVGDIGSRGGVMYLLVSFVNFKEWWG